MEESDEQRPCARPADSGMALAVWDALGYVTIHFKSSLVHLERSPA